MRTILMIMTAVLLTGCAAKRVPILRDGFALHERQWLLDEQEMRSRAAFELNCPAEALSLQVLAANGYASQVGVTGCEKRVIYVRGVGVGWIANSSSERR